MADVRDSSPGPESKSPRKRVAMILLIAVLLLLLALGVRWSCSSGVFDTLFGTGRGTRGGDTTGIGRSAVEDSLRRAADSAAIADSLATLSRLRQTDSIRVADSLMAARVADSLARLNEDRRRMGADAARRVDSADAEARRLAALAADSAARADSTFRADSIATALRDSIFAADPCARDTVQPWVYPDPSGGLHRKAISVVLVANKPAVVEWRYVGESAWRRYAGQTIEITRTSGVEFKAQDSCGNRMTPKAEHYDIDMSRVTGRCKDGMELVSIGQAEFCVDMYEWPNRRGTRPSAYVSQYQAADSCFLAGKRLCTSDEWKLACGGPYGWKYPYGDVFEERACATQDTGAVRSGSRPECRGYFEIYDMSGNLLEWTSTRSTANNRFFNVIGGFWESGSQSRCTDVRYSYFPQNRHNPVGFRCCADASARAETGGAR